MNPELKKKWLEALRSGDYDQGTHALCRVTDHGARYCCLGVLAEVEQGEDAWFRQLGDDALFISTPALGWSNISVYGIYGDHLLRSATVQTLISMNDCGKTFEEIADWIEERID